MRQIFLDTETTGLSPEDGDRVVEIGCVEMINRRLTGNNRHHHLNPERPNSEGAYRIHGLSDEFLAQQPIFGTVATDLMAYLKDAEIIIHNAAFDVGFLNAELKRVGLGLLTDHTGPVLDTLVMARDLYPGKSNSLDALCKRLEVDNGHRTLHGALLDAELLAEVYIRMTRGQDSLMVDIHHTGSAPARSNNDGSIQPVDLSQYTLAVTTPSDEERQAHATMLADLDKASGHKTKWRSHPSQAHDRAASI
jgi:DNA polymerase III subunit epsilon